MGAQAIRLRWRAGTIRFVAWFVAFALLNLAIGHLSANEAVRAIAEASGDGSQSLPLFRTAREDATVTTNVRQCLMTEDLQGILPQAPAFDFEHPDLTRIYREFLRVTHEMPTDAGLKNFLDRLSDQLIAAFKSNSNRQRDILAVSYRYRYILSRIQHDICTPRWLTAHYSLFYMRLRTIFNKTTFTPQTLEGFLLSLDKSGRRLSADDLKFVDYYMVDTPLNRLIRSVLGARSLLNSVQRADHIHTLCDELVATGIPSRSLSQAEISSGALNAALNGPGCSNLTSSQEPIRATIQDQANLFSVLHTNGHSLELYVDTQELPILDLSVMDAPVVLDKLPTPDGVDPITIPVLVNIRARTADGHNVPFFGRFDKAMLILHVFLKGADDAPLDTRPYLPARGGGNVTIHSRGASQGIKEKVSVVSMGQKGASVRSIPEAGHMLETYVEPTEITSYLLGAAAPSDGPAPDRVLVLGNPHPSQLQSLLRIPTLEGGFSVPDFAVDVPLSWISGLNTTMQTALAEHCAPQSVSKCLPSLVLVAFTRVLRAVRERCLPSSSYECDLPVIGLGPKSIQPPGHQGLQRARGQDGSTGFLTVDEQ